MTPEEAAGKFIFDTLRARAGLVALLATVDEWGAAVFPENIPEGDPKLPAVTYSQGDGRDTSPQGERQVIGLPFTVTVLKAGRKIPHNIAAEVDGALHEAKGVVGGFAITIARIGAGRPVVSSVGKHHFTAAPQRYLVGLSASLG